MQDPVTCARELVGCTLRWRGCAGRVVETEAYSADGDAACHTWTRPSARAFVAENAPGAAYVYFNYGVHWMLNVLVKGGAVDGFVLLRALEPLDGIAAMRRRRAAARRKATGPLALTALCSGPGKLAQALGVLGGDHGADFCTGGAMAFLPRAMEVRVMCGKRIGISAARDLPWRFLLAESAHVSVPLEKKKARPMKT